MILRLLPSPSALTSQYASITLSTATASLGRRANSTTRHFQRALLVALLATLLVALLAEPFTAVPTELNIRVDSMASAVRFRPFTTTLGEDRLSSRRLDPGIHRLFSRTRR